MDTKREEQEVVIVYHEPFYQYKNYKLIAHYQVELPDRHIDSWLLDYIIPNNLLG